MDAGLPQDRGLGCVIDDHVDRKRTDDVHVRDSSPVDSVLTLETAKVSDIVVDVQAKAPNSCAEGDWIEVSKSKGKQKGKGGRNC